MEYGTGVLLVLLAYIRCVACVIFYQELRPGSYSRAKYISTTFEHCIARANIPNIQIDLQHHLPATSGSTQRA